MRKLSLLLSLLLFPCLVQAQGALRRSEARSVSGPAIPGAQIYVCTSTAPLTPAPCQSNGGTEASIYSDIGLSVPITQPVIADGYGNFQYYASAGSYVESITGPGVVSISYPVMLAGVGTGCAATGTNGSLLYNNGGTCGASNLIYNGTGVFCKNFENIRCVDATNSAGWTPGTDFGAWVNDAIATLPDGGKVMIGVLGSISYTTPIVTTQGVTVECPSGGFYGNPGAATILTYTPTTGVAFSLEGAGSHLENCFLQGPGKGTSTIGLLVKTITGSADHITVAAFGVGYEPSNNTYLNTFIEPTFINNGKNMYVPSGLTQGDIENVSFIGGLVGYNDGSTMSATCIDAEGSIDWRFISTSWDDCGLTMGGSNINIELVTPHIENSGPSATTPFVTFGTSSSGDILNSFGGFWLEDLTASGRTDFIEDDSTTSNTLNSILLQGGHFEPAEVMSQLVKINHSCCDQFNAPGIIFGPGGNPPTAIATGFFTGNTSSGDFPFDFTVYPVHGINFIADQGNPCTNAELALSGGWGNTATVTGAVGSGQTCEWTITSNGTGTGANPTITDTLTNSFASASTVCDMRMVGGTGTATLINQTVLSATAPVFTFGGTPGGSGATYIVVRRCGP